MPRPFHLDDEEEDEETETETKAPAPEPPKPRLEERLLKARTILIYGGIDQKKAQDVSEKLIAMAADSDDDIYIYINSQGGHVEAGDTIHDMIRYVKPRVFIIGTGWVASAGALIYAAPPVERRLSLPNTRFMIHQPSGGVRGQASDISVEAEEILKMRQRLNEIFAKQTGQPIEKIERDSDRNFWMSAEQAKAYGLVGKVIATAGDLPAPAPAKK
ncbi:MAG: ATP-dependent Clp protease proteolytic subunit [Verrucomicrobium sp.]|nr:ATP-dependent Clp protease proteolytic subunit [Verrucomicrobium sp.]